MGILSWIVSRTTALGIGTAIWIGNRISPTCRTEPAEDVVERLPRLKIQRLLVDVRPEPAFREAHAPGSVSVPLEGLDDRAAVARLRGVRRMDRAGGLFFLLDVAGEREADLCRLARKARLSPSIVIEGGFDAWRKAGGAVRSPDGG